MNEPLQILDLFLQQDSILLVLQINSVPFFAVKSDKKGTDLICIPYVFKRFKCKNNRRLKNSMPNSFLIIDEFIINTNLNKRFEYTIDHNVF